MGLFSFIADAGEKIFGGAVLDEKQIREHILAQGVAIAPLTVVAHPEPKMVSLIGWAASLADKEKAIVTAGNIKGVAKVDDRLKVGSPPVRKAADTEPAAATPDLDAGDTPTSEFHTVVAGDSLSAIAKKYLGNASQYPKIFEANKPMLSDPDKIYPGQVLRIPKD